MGKRGRTDSGKGIGRSERCVRWSGYESAIDAGGGGALVGVVRLWWGGGGGDQFDGEERKEKGAGKGKETVQQGVVLEAGKGTNKTNL
ncbi:hypothetical protein GOBAR_AA37333 [Gossypium barbadense]|uniref:Uncharacterized protein n=1 Tax=Gossypium barbadense TaxID=3634 RepID=A0A2P5VX05_GOSBA|nr:hypothetical protein GOBAR_AA37333 [Gossypium barbadense]